MPLFGSHLSIAGGYFKAVEAAAALGMESVQLFTKNNNQWKGKPLGDDDVRLFREALERTGLQRPCAHNSYLINVASADEVLWQKSIDALVDELRAFSPLAQRTAKKLLNDTEDAMLSTAIELEGHCYSRLRQSDDFREGVEAFHAKRPAKFTGT